MKAKPYAAQLDGSTETQANSSVLIIFEYSVESRKYKLHGDLTREAMEEFIQLADEQGSAALALKEYIVEGKNQGLILAHSQNPGGWHCTKFSQKKSDRLTQIA
ncbi:MAG: hypothetical protein ACO3A2_01745 [Bdellovibrionia bacterium]